MDFNDTFKLAWDAMNEAAPRLEGYVEVAIMRLERKGKVHLAIRQDIANFIEALFGMDGSMEVVGALHDEELFSIQCGSVDSHSAAKTLVDAWVRLMVGIELEEQYKEKYGFFGDCGTYIGGDE